MYTILRITAGACLTIALVTASGCRVLGSVDTATYAWQGDLVAGADGAPSGTAAALSQGDRTEASIQISGGPGAGGVYRWRIRTGSCASPGSVIGGLALYPELELEAGGTISTNAVLTEGMPGGRNYHVVLVQASDDAEVACGQFRRL